MGKSNTGWRDSKAGTMKFAYFKNLDSEDIRSVEQFISDYQRLLILGKNDNLEGHFSFELDSCIALDYGHESQDVRTAIGELEYRAKYQESKEAVGELTALMSMAILRTPGCNQCMEPVIITYVPPPREKEFYLPRVIAEEMTARIEPFDLLAERIDLMHSVVLGEKPSLKNLAIGKKVQVWKRIFDEGRIDLSRDVNGSRVFVVDDLYQSGCTLWSFAAYLKSRGAAAVFGEVCVKAWRDTDNT